MGKLFKIILSVFFGLVVLIIAAVIALFIFVDPNDFKPEIEAAVKTNIGRTLTIQGDLELSIFPWIGLSTGEMILSNAPGFNDNPFATIKSSHIAVKLIPLFKQELEVKRIILEGMVLNLEKNEQGINNWDDLSESEEQSTPSIDPEQPNAPPMAFLAIGGFAIENAQIVWDDQQTGKHHEINAFNLHSESIKFDQPVGVSLSFTLLGIQPTLSQTVSLTTDMTVNETLDSFRFETLKLESVAEGETIPGGQFKANINSDINLNLKDQTVLLKSLQLSSEDLVINAELSGTNILDNPVFTGPVSIEPFNPRKQMQQLKLQLPSMQDSNTFKQFSMQYNLKADTESVALSNINMALDDSRIKGSVSVKNFKQPAYTFNIDIDAINLDRYLPEEQQPAAASNKSGNPAQTSNTPAVAVAAGATLIPVDTLKKLNAKGQLTIGKLHVSKTNMQGVQLNVSANKGVLHTKQTIRNLYKGNYSGSINIDVTGKQPGLSLNEKISQLQIGSLLKDRNSKIRMTGTASGSAKLQARGNRIEELKSSLSGLVYFGFKDGVVKGFNLQNIIKNATALIEGKPLPKANSNDQTAYSIINGNINFINGIAFNNDLLAKAPDLRVTGKGKAYLTTEKLDYQIIGRLLKSEATASEPEKIEGVPVHINIGGTFSEPVYAPDVVAMLKDKSNPEIERKKQKLLEKIDKKFGPEVKNILKKLF